MDLRFSQNLLYPDPAARDAFFRSVLESSHEFKTKYAGKPLSSVCNVSSLPAVLEKGFLPLKEYMEPSKRALDDHVLYSQPVKPEDGAASLKAQDQLAYITIADLEAEKRHFDRSIAVLVKYGVVGIGGFYALAQDTAGDFIILSFYAHNHGNYEQSFLLQHSEFIVFIKEPHVSGFGLLDREGKNVFDYPGIIRVANFSDASFVIDGSWDSRCPMAWAAPNMQIGYDIRGMTVAELVSSAWDFRTQGHTFEAIRRIRRAAQKVSLDENLGKGNCEFDDTLVKLMVINNDIMLSMGCEELKRLHLEILDLTIDVRDDLFAHLGYVQAQLQLINGKYRTALTHATRASSAEIESHKYKQLVRHCSMMLTRKGERGYALMTTEEAMFETPEFHMPRHKYNINEGLIEEGCYSIRATKKISPGETLAYEPAFVWRLGGMSKRPFFEISPLRKIIYPEHRVFARNAMLERLAFCLKAANDVLEATIRCSGLPEEQEAKAFLEAKKRVIVDATMSFTTSIIDSLLDKCLSMPTKAKRDAPRTSASPKLTLRQHNAYGTGIFLINKDLEHSCTPNAVWSTYGRLAILTAIKPISPGEAITVNFLHEELEFPERRPALIMAMQTRCHCALCRIELKEHKTEQKLTKKNTDKKQKKIWINGPVARTQKVQALMSSPAHKPFSEETASRIFHDFIHIPSAFPLYIRPATEQLRLSWTTLFNTLLPQLHLSPNDFTTLTKYIVPGPGCLTSLANLKLHFVQLVFEVLLGIRGFELDNLGIKTWGQLHPSFFHLTHSASFSSIPNHFPESFVSENYKLAWEQISKVVYSAYRWGTEMKEEEVGLGEWVRDDRGCILRGVEGMVRARPAFILRENRATLGGGGRGGAKFTTKKEGAEWRLENIVCCKGLGVRFILDYALKNSRKNLKEEWEGLSEKERKELGWGSLEELLNA